MAVVLPTDIKPFDVIRVPSDSRFTQRGLREVHAVVEESVTGRSGAIDQLMLFEIAPLGQQPSGTPVAALAAETAGRYGLNPDKRWAALLTPIAYWLDENRYFVMRTGQLNDADKTRIISVMNRQGGIDALSRRSGEGPRGMPTQSTLAYLPALGEDSDAPKRRYVRSEIPGKPRRASKAERGGLPNESTTVDLPLEFATQAANLDPRLVDALMKQGIATLRAARDLAQAQEKLDLIATHMTVPPAPDLSIDDAVTRGLLPAGMPGLALVTEPINDKTPKLTRLKELYDRARNGGEGFSAYTGLASKTGKARAELVAASIRAWEHYGSQSIPDADTAHTITRQIQKAWGQAMTEYYTLVRPHLNPNDLTQIRSREGIPEKYLHGEKTVFIFPKITGPK